MLKKIPIWSLISFVLSLLLTIGALTAFHACEMKADGTWMLCHKAQTHVAEVGLVLCILFLISMFIKNKAAYTFINIIGIIGSIIIIFIPGNIDAMCMMKTMRCYTVMQPFVRITAIIISVFAVISLIHFSKAVKKI